LSLHCFGLGDGLTSLDVEVAEILEYGSRIRAAAA
jgi:hypothetical protein